MLPMSTRSSSAATTSSHLLEALAARGRRRQGTSKRNHTSPFANDPTRLPPLTFSNTLSAPLPNPEHLSTALIDVLLHYSFRFPERGFTMPSDLLVGSSNTMEILKCFTDPKKYPPSSKEIIEPLQRNHSAYGSSPYRLLVPTCMASHYFTVDANLISILIEYSVMSVSTIRWWQQTQ
jgi:hypothetical protein